MKYVIEKAANGSVKLYEGDHNRWGHKGAPVIFSDDKEGERALEIFKIGLGQQAGASLFDAQMGRYVIGTVDQLTWRGDPIDERTGHPTSYSG